MLRASFGAFSGHVVALCAIGALTIFASGAATAGIQAAAGPAGTGLVILVFVILGNSASGGPFARPLLPGLWRTIGGVLPPGASVDLARSALFFDGARIAGPILVLVVWAALGTALALALGGRIMRPGRHRGSGRRGSGGVSTVAYTPHAAHGTKTVDHVDRIRPAPLPRCGSRN